MAFANQHVASIQYPTRNYAVQQINLSHGKNNHVEKCEDAWPQMENAHLGENLIT